MSTILPKNVELAGFGMPQIKKALLAYSRTGVARNLFRMKSMPSSALETAVLYEELLEKNLIKPEQGWQPGKLTAAGRAIAFAKAKRTPLDKAKAVLDEFLDRLGPAARSERPIFVVDKVWLYGSVLREADEVGDIDIAIEMINNPVFPTTEAWEKRRTEVLNLAPASLDMISAGDWHETRCVFGERRHPLLTGARLSTYELQQLGVPCQLVYDRSRGGRVADAVLSQHPDSKGRTAQVREPLNLGVAKAPRRDRS